MTLRAVEGGKKVYENRSYVCFEHYTYLKEQRLVTIELLAG